MNKLISNISELLTEANLLLNTLSRPNPKHISDKMKYEITHMKCKALITINLALILIFIIDMLLNRWSLIQSFIRCSFCLTVCIAIILSCRLHLNLFNIICNICCVCYGPYIMNAGDTGIHRAWFLAIVFPLYIYVFIADWKSFLFQTAVQAIYINNVYTPVIENAVKYMHPEDFVRNLTYSTNMAFVFCIVLILFTHHYMQHAYERIAFVEKKKDEVENQKNFLLGFSHELRNLINSLTGNVKLASLEVVTLKAKELLLNAEVCGELLLHLVNNILDTGKVEIGELEINPTPTRIYETLERIWGICSELIKRKNLNGKIRISKDLPKNVMIDHYRLTQIFLNLVGNSVKFTETGSVDISVDFISICEIVDEDCFQPYPFNYLDDYDEGLFEKQRTLSGLDKSSIVLGLSSKKISSSLFKDQVHNSKKGVLKIAVSDTGIGMSEEETKKLFQKFTQVTSDTSKRKLGTGLGLFITKELCHRMHGDIRVFSKKGVGSSFVFCVPVDVAQEECDLHTQDIESLKVFVRSQGLRALIVDDTPFNNALLKSFFDKMGIEVVGVARNGLEAYQKYSQLIEKEELLDIVTMDIEMPVMNGKEAARKIRRLEAEKGVKTCFMPIISGNCSESEIAECLNKKGDIKADRFIKKPATLEELLRAIGRHFVSSQFQKKNYNL